MFDFILKNKIKKLCDNDNKRQKRFYHINEIKTILIFFETSDYEAADAFIEMLGKMGKKVIAYGYKVKDDQYDYSETPFRIIVHKDDTDWMGNPWSNLTNELIDIQADVIIDLTINENLTIEYLVAFLNTPFKVGLKKSYLLYDLSINNLPQSANNQVSEVTELGKQILFYLNSIHSA